MSESNGGWIKIYKKIWQNPVVCRDSETFMIWVYLLTEASHSKRDYLFGGERITLRSGQLLTTVKKISEELSIERHKVERTLANFEKHQQIEKRKSNQNTLINIVNWSTYQNQNEKRMRNEWETNEKPVSNDWETDEKPTYYYKNNKNNKEYIEYKDSQEYAPAPAPACEACEACVACEEEAEEKPSIDEISEYAEELGSRIDCRRFRDYYEKRSWMCGGSVIADWRALFRSWNDKARASPPSFLHGTTSSFDTDEFFQAALRRGMDINNF